MKEISKDYFEKLRTSAYLFNQDAIDAVKQKIDNDDNLDWEEKDYLRDCHRELYQMIELINHVPTKKEIIECVDETINYYLPPSRQRK